MALPSMVQKADAPKFCKDCKWCELGGGDQGKLTYARARCTNPKNEQSLIYDLVSGFPYENKQTSCSDQRMCVNPASGPNRYCTKDGLWWEPRDA